jgi:hypothetical protein
MAITALAQVLPLWAAVLRISCAGLFHVRVLAFVDMTHHSPYGVFHNRSSTVSHCRCCLRESGHDRSSVRARAGNVGLS